MNLKSMQRLELKSKPGDPYNLRLKWLTKKAKRPVVDRTKEAKRLEEKNRENKKERNRLNKIQKGGHHLDGIIRELRRQTKFPTITELRRAVVDAAKKRSEHEALLHNFAEAKKWKVTQLEVDCRTSKFWGHDTLRGKSFFKGIKPPKKFNATEWREKLYRAHPDVKTHPLHATWLSFGNSRLIEQAQQLARIKGINGEVAEARKFLLTINPPTQRKEVSTRFDAAIKAAMEKKG